MSDTRSPTEMVKGMPAVAAHEGIGMPATSAGRCLGWAALPAQVNLC